MIRIAGGYSRAPSHPGGPIRATAILRDISAVRALEQLREEPQHRVDDDEGRQLAAGGPVGRKLDFLAQELNRESNTLCAKSKPAIARTTKQIRLGVAINVLPLHNPIDVAESYAMVDVISGGRLVLGIGAVAGIRLVKRYGWKLGQKLPIASEIHARADGSMNWEFDLVGIIDADDPAVRGNTDMVLINVAYFDEARQIGKGKTGWYIVRIADSTQARFISASIDTLFMNSPDETKTQPEKEFAIGFAKQIGDIGALVTRILVAVFFTILILTGNTMAQSIRERIPELAILKTLGFSDGKVTALVLAEALLLMGLGASLEWVRRYPW